MKAKPRLFYTPCDSHQAGALLYANRQYAKLDPERRLPQWLQWLRLRDNWFAQQETIYGKGNFTCVLCGKPNLRPWVKDKKKLATIDHILPVSKFPTLWNVPSNFQVACYRCNQNKRDTYQ